MTPIPACQYILAKCRPLRVLVLDDEPDRVDAYRYAFAGTVDLVHVPSAGAANHNLKMHSFDCVFLDHDLELSVLNWGILDHGNGQDVVSFLKRMGPQRWNRTAFIIHSLNFRRGAIMFEDLFAAGFHVSRRAYAWHDIADLQNLARDWVWPMNLERWDCALPPSKPVLRQHSVHARAAQGSR